MLSPETIQEVRDRVKVAEVVGDRVKLQRKGRSLAGLCPFHKEKSPSFHVNEERGFYYCFGCHASGDSIKFVQETEGLGFSEAIRELALRYGVEIVETRDRVDRQKDEAARRLRDDLLQCNEVAAQFFEQSLFQHPLGHWAREELERRGLEFSHHADAASDPMQLALRAFRVGYAPYSWNALAEHLRDAGANLKAAESVGLVAPRKQGAGFYDRFRHRLMFAVVDLRGKVVAFSGRALGEPDQAQLSRLGISALGTSSDTTVAKYMNSPESGIYKKREIVFGLFQARDAVRQQDECVVVEGNFDVLSLHARGLQNVVAPLGTAFTREQAAQIRRYSAKVTVLFDPDTAGVRASIAAREPAREEGLIARVAQLPKGEDPDEFVRTRGPDALKGCLRNAKGMLEFLIDQTLETGGGTDAQALGRKIAEVTELIRQEPDATVRALAQAHADSVAARLGIHDTKSVAALSRAIRAAARGETQPERRSVAPESARSKAGPRAVEESILGALVEYPMLLDEPTVVRMLAHASGELALAISVLRQHQHDLPNNLPRFPKTFGDVVARHMAAPETSQQEIAREVLLENLHRLERLDGKRSKAETVELLRRAAESGDIDAELQLLSQLSEQRRERERLRAEIEKENQ